MAAVQQVVRGPRAVHGPLCLRVRGAEGLPPGLRGPGGAQGLLPRPHASQVTVYIRALPPFMSRLPTFPVPFFPRQKLNSFDSK